MEASSERETQARQAFDRMLDELQTTPLEREMLLETFILIQDDERKERRARLARARLFRRSRLNPTQEKASRSCDSLERTARTALVSHSPIAKDCEHDPRNRIVNSTNSLE